MMWCDATLFLLYGLDSQIQYYNLKHSNYKPFLHNQARWRIHKSFELFKENKHILDQQLSILSYRSIWFVKKPSQPNA